MQALINFETHDPEKTVRLETRHLVQGYFTFVLQVCSGAFQGKSSFCVSQTQLQEFSGYIAKMNQNLSGKAVLNDNDSDAFIILESINNGQIIVSGQVGGTHEDQFMKFRFETDQTILHPLHIQIDGMLSSVGLQE